MDERAKLASQLVRCHALLWSVEDAKMKETVRARIRAIEGRIAELDGTDALPPPHRAAVTSRLAR